jgi:hypothetical protein
LFVELKIYDFSNNYVELLINIDDQNVKTFNEHFVHYDRIKHVDIIYHYVKDEIKKNRIKLNYIIIDIMFVDDFIKFLSSIKYQRFIEMLNIN